MSRYDLVIVGAGPAGLSAALEAAAVGVKVLVIDEAPAPGGQIWRASEAKRDPAIAEALGPDYLRGGDLVARFRAAGIDYWPQRQVWQVDRDGSVYASDGASSKIAVGQRVLLAIGAQERPVPIPGWTLPGVMSVGAAQILLKTAGMLPDPGVWIAGCGPLPLVYAAQVVAAGGKVAGFLETTSACNLIAAAPLLGAALPAWRSLAKGLDALKALKRGGIRRIRVDAVEAVGGERIETVRYRRGDRWTEVPASGLLLHEGVIPNVHMTMAIGCAHDWDDAQRCWRPRLDGWGATTIENIYVAGDGGGIGGADAAVLSGRVVGLGIAASLGKIDMAKRDRAAAPILRELFPWQGLRPFLDRLYRPRRAIEVPADSVTVCRCESITAATVRDAVRSGCLGPNQAKAFTRAGMGPCQGRMCGLTVANVIADERQAGLDEVGFYRIRPPLKPLTLGELAALEGPEAA